MTVYRPGGLENGERPRGPALSEAMSACLARNWWAVLLRGILADAQRMARLAGARAQDAENPGAGPLSGDPRIG